MPSSRKPKTSRRMKIAGKPVVDATKPLILTITANDIRAGKAGQPAACAAAQACMRQLHIKEARVHLGRIYLNTGKEWVRYQTPNSIRSEIIAYDRRTSFKPGDYKLNPLPPGHRGVTGGQNKSKRGRKGHERVKPHFIEGVRVRAAMGAGSKD